MNSKKKINLEETYERIINVGLCIVPYEDLSDLAVPELMLFGTTKDEKIFSFSELDAMFKSQYEQMDGFVPSLDRKRLYTRISNDGNNAYITEEVTLTISSPKEVNNIFMRCSCVMEYIGSQWKLTHWHASTPVDTENDHWHMEEWKREKEKLQKLVDQQTADLKDKNRELEIETALERIRSSSLAMQKTDDLRNVVAVLFEQMQELSVDMSFASVSIFIFEEESRDFVQWLPTPEGVASLHIPYIDHPISSDLFDAREDGTDYFEKIYTVEEKNAWLENGFELTDYKHLPEEFKTSLLEAPGYAMSISLAKHSGICIPSFEGKLPSPENVAILKRVGKVFDQVYTRFLDLQKAEAQAREAQIEAALERVRSKSLAMHKTAELQSVIHAVHQELLNLDLSISGGSFIIINKEIDNDLLCWGSGGTADYSDLVHIPHFEKPFYTHLLNKIKSGPGFFTEEYTREEKVEFFSFLFQYEPWSSLDSKQKEETLSEPGGYTRSCIVSKHTSIFIINHFGDKFSEAENAILRRFGKVFEQSYTRFLDLQKAEAQAREAEIELALERVRARTMAMQNSEQLAEVSSLLFQQMEALGINTYGSGFTIWDEDRDKLISWVCNADGSLNPPFYLPMTEEPWHKEQYESWKKGEDFIVKDLAGEEWKAYLRYLRSFPLMDKAFAISEAAGHPTPERQVHHAANFSHGNLLFITLEPRPEAHELFKRFAKVFEQTYTRFLDLKKAEEQAREAQIEAALERVRSRSMAMRKTEELADAIGLLQRELAQLEFALDNCIFWIIDKESNEATLWVAPVNDTNLPEPYHVPFTNLPYFREVFQAWELRNPKWTYVLEGEDKKRVDEYLFNQTGFRNFPADVKNIFLQVKKTYVSISFYNYGGLHVSTEAPISESQSEILSRFSKVFDQTYTRFLDLQKAEAQTREAQINLAVERVRAKALAMFKSEEILGVVHKLKEEIMGLNISNVTAATIHLKEPDGRYRAWDLTSIDGDEKELQISLDISYNMDDTHPDFFMREVWERPEDYFVVIQDTDRTPHTVQWLQQNGYSQEAKEFEEFLEASQLEQAYHPTVPLKNGRMSIDLLEPPEPEVESILKKMAGAFDLAYKRFEDLQKAEAQTREAQLELSLERIRAQVTAMQESSDLFDVVVSMRNEFLSLGHDADYFWHMRWLPESYEMSMTSEAGDRIGMVITIPGFVHEQIPGLAEWEKGDAPTYVLALDAEGAWDYIDNMNTHGRYEVADPNAPTKEDIEQIGGLTFIIARTTHGEIGYSLPGVAPNPPKDAMDTLVRFAGVFDLAYKRFEDLKAAERQALLIREERDRLEIALNELHATQDQLVQQEKLASLGQLTAGIAHEIKNPLNFVNNFSELSIEMVEEAREEVKQKLTADSHQLTAILNDIETNLLKIHEHGSRADSIVKSMLEHSRGGSGKPEPTDLNALVKEFTNLSFHGMRASKEPISVDMKYELDKSIGKVPLVAEDFSRVIVNLCNNAFDAMREKLTADSRQLSAESDQSYEPRLTIRTITKNATVTIEIEDNGPGIPEDMKDNILQPFFTTKKGTQGTGLGLSITHDIIKAHGGSLNVDSQPGQTVFTIKLTA